MHLHTERPVDNPPNDSRPAHQARRRYRCIALFVFLSGLLCLVGALTVHNVQDAKASSGIRGDVSMRPGALHALGSLTTTVPLYLPLIRGHEVAPPATAPATFTPTFTPTVMPETTETPTFTSTATQEATATATSVPGAEEGDREWDPRLDQRGAELLPASVEPGQGYWRLVRGVWYDEQEAGGKHHIFVDVLDAEGNRMPDVPVRFYWNDGEVEKLTEAKPGDEYAANYAMYAVAPAYGAYPNDGHPFDNVWGMGLGSLELPYHTVHTSYGMVWQWTEKSSGGEEPTATATPIPSGTSAPPTSTPTATPTSTPPSSDGEYLFDQAVLVRCDPNQGVTYVHGTLRLNGEPANGYLVAFSYEPDGLIVAQIQSGPHPGYEGWDPGYYSHILQAGGMREGDWWFWIVDGAGNRISELGYVHTHGTAGDDKCQQAVIDFGG